MHDGVSVKGGGIRGGERSWEGIDFSFYERGERILGRAWSIGQSGIYSGIYSASGGWGGFGIGGLGYPLIS